MKKGGSGAKGAAYERACCQRLSMWVSELRREDCFWRSAMSGGRATLKSRKVGKFRAEFGAQAGDITATHELGNHLCSLFVLDGKHYKNLEIEQLIYGRRSAAIRREWVKLKRDGKASQKIPMMIARQNRRPDIIVTNPRGYALLRTAGDLPILAVVPGSRMVVCLFRDVLALPYKRLRKTKTIADVKVEHAFVGVRGLAFDGPG